MPNGAKARAEEVEIRALPKDPMLGFLLSYAEVLP
jgi:hypothetical protein